MIPALEFTFSPIIIYIISIPTTNENHKVLPTQLGSKICMTRQILGACTPLLVTTINRKWILGHRTTSTYQLVRDMALVKAVFNMLVAYCLIYNPSGVTSYSSSRDSWAKAKQVIQYYRTSSFVLSLDDYSRNIALGPHWLLQSHLYHKFMECFWSV